MQPLGCLVYCLLQWILVFSSIAHLRLLLSLIGLETIDIVGSNKLLLIGKKEVDVTQAYCMKCRTKREMKDAKAVTMKNGKPATQGVCPTCGTKMFRIGKS